MRSLLKMFWCTFVRLVAATLSFALRLRSGLRKGKQFMLRTFRRTSCDHSSHRSPGFFMMQCFSKHVPQCPLPHRCLEIFFSPKRVSFACVTFEENYFPWSSTLSGNHLSIVVTLQSLLHIFTEANIELLIDSALKYVDKVHSTSIPVPIADTSVSQ